MSESKEIAQPRPTELDTYQGYDFDLGDFGNQPDYTKDDLDGKVIIVYGVSQATFDSGQFQTGAKSLLHKLPNEDADIAPYGMMFSESSPVIRQAAEMEAAGKVPFMARLVKKGSKQNKGQSYWTLERAPSLQFDTNGNALDPNK